MDPAEELVAALQVLAGLVYLEFPGDMSLAEIAETWGDCTPEQIQSLKRSESLL